MRPIDADEIVKVAEHAYDEWNLAMAAADGKRQIDCVYKMQELCKAVRAVAKAAPTIDPESLRPQGKWIRYHEADLGWDEWGYRCSNCKLDVDDDNIDFPMNYCPNCGAKMTTKKGDADD